MFYQITALFIWSSAFVAAKYTYGMMDAVMMVQIRLVISALVVLPVCRRYLGRIPRQSWRPLILLSFLNYIGVLMFQFVGLKYTSATSFSATPPAGTTGCAACSPLPASA